MKRGIIITLVAGMVAGVGAALARDAAGFAPGASRALLLGLLVFIAFEWFAHFLGSRALETRPGEQVRNARAFAVGPRWSRTQATRPSVGPRWSRTQAARPDRAAWAALSSAGIWIVMLVGVPKALFGLGVPPAGTAGVLLMTVAAVAGLAGRLWFLREIYEVELERAATLWAASRGAAVLLVCTAVAIYAVSASTGIGASPALSWAP